MVEKMGRIVAIVGFAGSSRELVNKEPEGVEVWGLNSAYSWMSEGSLAKASRWFDIHGYEGRDQYRGEHWEKMLAMGVPIYSLHPPVPRPENVVDLEYDTICKDLDVPIKITGQAKHEVERLGIEPYFTNTVAYMIAQAIWEGVDHIKLFGVDMATGGEFENQRPCCEAWIYFARGRGIQVTLPASSPLCRGLLYGVDRNDGFTRKTLLDTMSDLNKQELQALVNYHQAVGGLKQITDLTQAFADWENDHGPITRDDVHGMIGAMMEAVHVVEREQERQYYAVDGAKQMTRALMHKFFLPDMTTAEIETPELADIVRGEMPALEEQPEPQAGLNGQYKEALQNA